MSEPQTWAEALNINPEKLVEWSAQAPEGKPVLVYCLEQGLVDYALYAAWAQERFQLPLLQANFFHTALNAELLDQAKNSGEWQPWTFPVERWEGITIVACVEPPAEEAAADLRFVLADPRAMIQAWGGEVAPPALIDMPTGLSNETKMFVLDIGDAIMGGPETPPTDVTNVTAPPPALRVVSPEASVAPKPATPAQTNASEDAALHDLFTSLNQRYANSFVMKCRDQEAYLYKWDQALKPADDAAKTTLNLSYPNFLRIVAKTGLPYHGYLVDSPTHRDFFAALGFNELPFCVTAIPIRFDQNLWGIVVAFGGEENQKTEVLNFAQETVERLMNAVGAQWSKAA